MNIGALLAGLFSGIIGGMGLGGGGLLVIYLSLVCGVEQMIAQGANLSFFIISALASTLFNLKKKRIIWKTTLLISACGIAGALLGTLLAGTISPEMLRKIFGGMLIVAGLIGIFNG